MFTNDAWGFLEIRNYRFAAIPLIICLCSYKRRRFVDCISYIAAILLIGFPSTIQGDGIPQYVHTRWSVQDGATVFPIQALAQTKDGYLWLGTSHGLWRFDGFHFEFWRPRIRGVTLPSADIRCLEVAHDGGLWIGTSAGIRKLKDGRLEDSPLGHDEWAKVRTLLEDSNNTLWVGMDYSEHGSLAVVNRNEIRYYGPSDGLVGGVQALLRDHSGALWVGTRFGLWRWPKDRGMNLQKVSSAEIFSITQTASGNLLTVIGSRNGIESGLNGRFKPVYGLNSVGGTAIRVDHADNIWFGTFSHGVARVRHGQVEWFKATDGLSNSMVTALLEDRDGNIWVGTPTGLDRLRPTVINHIAVKEGLSEDLVSVVESGGREGVWIGTSSSGINQIDLHGVVHTQPVKGLPSNSITSLYKDAGNRLWVGTSRGFALCVHDVCRKILGPNGEALDRVVSITGSGNDNVWLADGRKGIYVISKGIVKRLAATGLPSVAGVYGLLPAANGLWIGYYQGQVAMVDGNSVKLYGAADGIAQGAVLAMYRDSRGDLWIGGSAGLSRFHNGVWNGWTIANGLTIAPIYDLIADSYGSLWLTTSQGLVQLDPAELGSEMERSGEPLRYHLYGIASGMIPPVNATWPRPRVARSADGHLWFATDHGVATIAPDVLRKPASETPIVIEEINVDGYPRERKSGTATDIEFRGRNIRFDYTAINLSSSDNIRFRYRLNGFDRNWSDAGGRRQAFYTNLPPGKYTFTVTATSLEGTWAGIPAVLTFKILPVFYETLEFKATLTAVAFALLFGLYRLRLTQVMNRLQASAEERLIERTRIARELHDTLLQAIVGVSLQLESLATCLPEGSDVRQAEIRRIQSHLTRALQDTRRTVWALRASIGSEHDLATILKEQTGTFSGRGGDIHVSTTIKGNSYPLKPEIEEELLRIAQSAITNAIAHSKGSHIDVCLIYELNTFLLRISDDGCGIDAKMLQFGRSGHFGLRGMRERAERIGARFSIASQLGRGTVIEVIIETKKSIWAHVTELLKAPVSTAPL